MGIFQRKSSIVADDPPRYSFTSDWFSSNQYLFEKNLSQLQGRRCRLLEIGVYEGRSTCWLLNNVATHRRSEIVSIDPHLKDVLYSNIEATGKASRVRFHESFSSDVLLDLKSNYFDFIYIDGSHKEMDVLIDAMLAFSKTKVGGIIAFDDYEWAKYGGIDSDGTSPGPAIDRFLKTYNKKIEILDKAYQVWIRKLSN